MKKLKLGDRITYFDENTIIEGVLEKDSNFVGGWVVVSEGANVSYEIIKKYIIKDKKMDKHTQKKYYGNGCQNCEQPYSYCLCKPNEDDE